MDNTAKKYAFKVIKRHDLREKYYFNNARDQGTSPCCWSFATTEAVEFLFHKRYKDKRVSLSTQHLYNNAIPEDDEEDDGFKIRDAFDFILHNGCVKEDICPYVDKRGECIHEKKDKKENIRIGSFKEIPLDELESVVEKKAVVGQIHFTDEFSELKGDDIYFGPSDPSEFLKHTEKHAVLIVGSETVDIDFGDRVERVECWIVKNSHGESWGNKGYGRISKSTSFGRDLIECAFAASGVEDTDDTDIMSE